MSEEFKCLECGEAIDLDHDDYWSCDDGYLCWGCYEAESERCSTLIRFSEDGKEVARFSEHICEDTEYGEEAPWVHEVVGPREWHSTDPWRGYYDSPLQEGYVGLAAGWATGRWSDVPWKHTVNDLGDWLADYGEEAPGEGIYVLIEPTSNVFSLATTFLCKAGDAEEVCVAERERFQH